jgi:translation initiation factor 2-alpha kinase 4
MKDDIFDGLRDTRLSKPETWKDFIQHAPPAERNYLSQIFELLKDMARDAKANGTAQNAFIYNFRTRGCICYDIRHTPSP